MNAATEGAQEVRCQPDTGYEPEWGSLRERHSSSRDSAPPGTRVAAVDLTEAATRSFHAPLPPPLWNGGPCIPT